jgi:hypothetical protein
LRPELNHIDTNNTIVDTKMGMLSGRNHGATATEAKIENMGYPTVAITPFQFMSDAMRAV